MIPSTFWSIWKNCQAVIFDLDGVIVDTEPLKFEAYRTVFQRNFGVQLPETDISWRGKSEPIVMRYWLNKFGLEMDIPTLINQKRQAYQTLLKATPLMPTSGLSSFLEIICHAKKCGLATGSDRLSQQTAMENLGIAPYFEAILTRDDVDQPKPNPEIYQKVSQKLGIQPENCIVFEDSPTGIAAAKAIGMYCIGLETSYTKTELAQADFIIPDFSVLSVSIQ